MYFSHNRLTLLEDKFWVILLSILAYLLNSWHLYQWIVNEFYLRSGVKEALDFQSFQPYCEWNINHSFYFFFYSFLGHHLLNYFFTFYNLQTFFLLSVSLILSVFIVSLFPSLYCQLFCFYFIAVYSCLSLRFIFYHFNSFK